MYLWISGNSLPISIEEEAILFSLLNKDRYGLEIIEAFSKASDARIQLNFGTVYPKLKKLKEKGFIDSYMEEKRSVIRRGNRRKYYKLTEKGRNILNQISSFRRDLIHIN